MSNSTWIVKTQHFWIFSEHNF